MLTCVWGVWNIPKAQPIPSSPLPTLLAVSQDALCAQEVELNPSFLRSKNCHPRRPSGRMRFLGNHPSRQCTAKDQTPHGSSSSAALVPSARSVSVTDIWRHSPSPRLKHDGRPIMLFVILAECQSRSREAGWLTALISLTGDTTPFWSGPEYIFAAQPVLDWLSLAPFHFSPSCCNLCLLLSPG